MGALSFYRNSLRKVVFSLKIDFSWSFLKINLHFQKFFCIFAADFKNYCYGLFGIGATVCYQ